MKTYNYYVNKLLLARVDPFIEKQNRLYLREMDFNKLGKISNVFNRLTASAKLDFINLLQNDRNQASLAVVNSKSISHMLDSKKQDLDSPAPELYF